jgi:hypothetical protein
LHERGALACPDIERVPVDDGVVGGLVDLDVGAARAGYGRLAAHHDGAVRASRAGEGSEQQQRGAGQKQRMDAQGHVLVLVTSGYDEKETPIVARTLDRLGGREVCGQ